MTIIRLNEEGHPLRNNPDFPNWLIVAHVALIGASTIAALVLGVQ